MSRYEQEVLATGELSDRSMGELKAVGLEKFAVKFIEGQKALQARQVAEVVEVVGGQEQFNSIKEWATSNLTAAEKTAFNSTLKSGSTEDVKLALAGINARYRGAVGNVPGQISGHRTSSGPTPFRDFSEVTTAMNDPRYAKSEAYRNDVMRRMEVSNL
jgi:hypothetical protein